MAKPALDDLYDIMNDGTAGIPTRLRAGVAASRVEPLSMPSEATPPGVTFLRSIVAGEHAGLMFHHDLRREAASALAYYERRVKKAELQYSVPDPTEQKRQWISAANAALRACLAARNLWPQRKDILLGVNDSFEQSLGNPERALIALLQPAGGNRHARRKRAVDDPGSVPAIASEAEREAIIKPITKAVAARLREFGLTA